MLSQFRSFAKSPAANVLLVLVLLGFVFVGGRSVINLGAGAGDAVVRAGGRTIGSAQFRTMFDRYRSQIAQQQQQQSPGAPPSPPMSVKDAVAQGLDTRALDELAAEESMATLIGREGLRPADALIAAELRKAPALFDPLTGKFDRAAYSKFLAQSGVSEKEFEAGLRDQIAQQHLFAGLAAALRAPAVFSALEASFNHEGRSVETITLGPGQVPPPPPPREADLRAFMRDNAKSLVRPEMRIVTLVRFSASLLAPSVRVDPSAVEKRFAFEKDTLSTLETRDVVQIPLNPGQSVTSLIARLKAGEPASVVAGTLGAKPIVYTRAVRAAIPDPQIAAAAFAMASGDVRGPVAGSLGPALLQVLAVAPGRVATLDDARPRIEAEVRKAAAAQAASAQVQKYEDARSGGAGLVDAAKAAGVTPVEAPSFDAQGHTVTGQPLPVPQKLVQTAFALASGADSQVLEAGRGQGEFYAIHLTRISPPAALSLEEIRAPLTQRLRLQALLKALKAKADAIASQIRAGQSPDDVARSAGLGVVKAQIRRDDAQASTTYSRELLGAVFAAKPGEVVVAADVKLGVVIARVDAALAQDPREVAVLAQAARDGASGGLFEDLAAHARDAARLAVKPTIDVARARRAIGADPSTGRSPTS